MTHTHTHRALERRRSQQPGGCVSRESAPGVLLFPLLSRINHWTTENIDAQKRKLITDNKVLAAWSDNAKREGEKECVAVRGVYINDVNRAVKHSGASCYRPYTGPRPPVSLLLSAILSLCVPQPHQPC